MRRVNYKELRNLYKSPIIFMVIESRGMTWKKCEMRSKFWLENLEETIRKTWS